MRVSRIPQLKSKTEKESNIDLNLIDSIIEKYKNKKGSLIPLLQGAQNIYGYIPTEIFHKISKETGIELNDLYGVATFYAQFRLNPVGKHIIKICHGTACHVQNATALTDSLKEALGIEDGQTTPDNIFTLESVACLGCCSLAPVMMIGEDTYGNLEGKDAVKIIKEIKLSESNN